MVLDKCCNNGINWKIVKLILNAITGKQNQMFGAINDHILINCHF
jgi:hypothetical protein